MTTQRRMTQQSRKQLKEAAQVRIEYDTGDGGYHIIMHTPLECCAYVVTSAVGAMTYPTPTAAMRAIRRIRPDLRAEDVAVAHRPRDAGPVSRRHAEGVAAVCSVSLPEPDGSIEVYGSPLDGWYEYRRLDTAGRTIADTGQQGRSGMQYGDPMIAMQAALAEYEKGE